MGVGKAWPIIRSHTVLNNLHAVVDQVPRVIKARHLRRLELVLDEIKDDNYYRF